MKKINEEITHLQATTASRLEDSRLYTPMLDYQVEAVSIILTKIRMLVERMSREDYEPIVNEQSREGAPRLKPNPCEKVLQDYLQILLRALKGLGMSGDPKTMRPEPKDELTILMEELSDKNINTKQKET